jgi:hypothetical protein
MGPVCQISYAGYLGIDGYQASWRGVRRLADFQV